jgi:hypothetical protein
MLAPSAVVASGNPVAPFFARDLKEDLRTRAEAACLQATVTKAWLDTCTLDAAVVGEKAGLPSPPRIPGCRRLP